MSVDMKKYFALMESVTSEEGECGCSESCTCDDKLDESFLIEAEGEHKARIEEVIRKIEECGVAEKSFEMAVNVLEKVGGETYSSTASGAIEDLLPILEGDIVMLDKAEECLRGCGLMEDEEMDLDTELALEIADSLGLDDEHEYEPDVEPEEESEEESEEVLPTFNYTATIQLHGYDYPLVLQADDMDEIKTVMRVLEQSGLAPEGEYKWNSRAIDLTVDDDE